MCHTGWVPVEPWVHPLAKVGTGAAGFMCRAEGEEWSRGGAAVPSQRFGCLEESKVLDRIHMLMEYSYNHNAAGLFLVVQNMVFVWEAE